MEEKDQLTFEGFNYKKKKLPTRGGLITSVLTKDVLEDLYFNQSKSLQDIAKEYNCTRQMVKLLMEKYGIHRRNRSEARVLAIKEGKFKNFEYDPINENFFGAWTPQMAWVLGLLFTDGYIMEDGGGLRAASGLRVVLTSIDKDMLENVRRHLNSTRPIQRKVQSYDRTKHIYSFEFYREAMRDDLISLGLLQRKSLTIRFPDVPRIFIRHFIRGCWDGDGTVYTEKNGKLNASYVSGAKEFIEKLVEELYRVGIYRKKIFSSSKDIEELERLRATYPLREYPLKIHIEHRSKSPSYSIKVSSKENLEKLFKYFYDGVDESMYLKRKYDVFVKGLNLSEKELILQTESKMEFYVPIPIQSVSKDRPPKISRKIQDVIWSTKARDNKKVLTIKNSDRRLKCWYRQVFYANFLKSAILNGLHGS